MMLTNKLTEIAARQLADICGTPERHDGVPVRTQHADDTAWWWEICNPESAIARMVDRDEQWAIAELDVWSGDRAWPHHERAASWLLQREPKKWLGHLPRSEAPTAALAEVIALEAARLARAAGSGDGYAQRVRDAIGVGSNVTDDALFSRLVVANLFWPACLRKAVVACWGARLVEIEAQRRGSLDRGRAYPATAYLARAALTPLLDTSHKDCVVDLDERHKGEVRGPSGSSVAVMPGIGDCAPSFVSVGLDRVLEGGATTVDDQILRHFLSRGRELYVAAGNRKPDTEIVYRGGLTELLRLAGCSPKNTIAAQAALFRWDAIKLQIPAEDGTMQLWRLVSIDMWRESAPRQIVPHAEIRISLGDPMFPDFGDKIESTSHDARHNRRRVVIPTLPPPPKSTRSWPNEMRTQLAFADVLSARAEDYTRDGSILVTAEDRAAMMARGGFNQRSIKKHHDNLFRVWCGLADPAKNVQLDLYPFLDVDADWEDGDSIRVRLSTHHLDVENGIRREAWKTQKGRENAQKANKAQRKRRK